MSLLGLLVLALQLYALIVLARVILSWFPIRPGSALEPIDRFVYAATEPVLSAIRSVVPPLRLGNTALDLAALLLLLGIQLLIMLITR
jgi:YggT family protein